ncbi:MAG: cytochrome C biogenesis protein CcmH [Acidiferrobacteraceae bacterium]|mgnify:CR=1 FL=1|nr:cytochrome C biogenesis protein CcmH [Acidiferrobacteraceae bacterium]|tara:strand:- start:1411 stop:1905 length:495 start_codon:yes stop_codon:yes gene_type:complete
MGTNKILRLGRHAFFLTLAIVASSLTIHPIIKADIAVFSDHQHERRYRDIIAELRCLVCQNQNLADSNADLAKDLRKMTYDMVIAGYSDEHIMEFMVKRYGDFVRYKPPFNRVTIILWIAPGMLLVGGVIIIWSITRRSPQTTKGSRTLDRKRIRQELEESQEQ